MVMIVSPSSFDRRVNLAIRLFPAYFAASKNSFFSEDSLFLCKRRNEEAHHRPVIANRGPMRPAFLPDNSTSFGRPTIPPTVSCILCLVDHRADDRGQRMKILCRRDGRRCYHLGFDLANSA
jgi:hypothetical protein